MRTTALQRGVATARRIASIRGIREVWMYLVRITERMEDNHIFLSGAAIAFNSFLCFIPLVLVIFYVLGLYLDSASALATINSYLDSLDMIPYEREYIRERVIMLVREFVGGSSLAGIIGLVGLIWTSSALFAALRVVLNRIFAIRDTRNFVVSKLKDLALLSTVGIALVLITALSYGMTLIRGLAESWFGLAAGHWLLEGTLLHLSTGLLNFMLFCVVFVLVPDQRISWRVVLLSSGIAAVFWGVAKALFGYYLANLWSIGRVYGPYAVLVATAIWIYYSSITLLVAAEIGEMARERRQLKKLFQEKRIRRIMASSEMPDLVFPDTESKQGSDS